MTEQANRNRHSVGSFLRGLWRAVTWIRIGLANIIFIGVIILLIVLLSSSEDTRLPDEFALTLTPSGVLVDQLSYTDPMTLLLMGREDHPRETLLSDLIDAVNNAAEDPRINALVLETDYFQGGGLSKMEELGVALHAFRESGKPIYAVGSYYTQQQYFLASHADEIFLNDMGMVLLTGYGIFRQYYHDALERLNINFHLFRSGDYKDAMEHFARSDMSEASREHYSELLNQLWGVYTSRVEELRNLPSGAIDDYINNIDHKLREQHGDFSSLALHSGLVDSVLSNRELEEHLIDLLGHCPCKRSYNGVSHRRYLSHVRRAQAAEQVVSRAPGIGLLVASGAILDGERPEGEIGSDTFARLLRQVREDDDIKALVLRIDSGGGSAFASEVIRDELAATRASGIPVLISMGSVAASGGYWIAAGADEIWATPTTITGSIGVIGAVVTFEDALASLGIHTDGVGTTRFADALRLDRPVSEQTRQVFQMSVDNIYRRFVSLVAEARGSTPEEIDRLAQGRVWSGDRALELGLVDQLGNLNDVIEAAAERAGLEEYRLVPITRPLSAKEQFFRQLAGRNAGSLMPRTLLDSWFPPEARRQIAPMMESLGALGQLNDPRHIYSICVECIAP